MNIKIFSFAVNDKFPIDIQHRQFIKYLKEDFEFILFNDAFEVEYEKNINLICSFNKIKCVKVPQNIHLIQNPSESYAATLNWAVHNYAVNNNCDIIVLLHSDIFPICEINISNIIGNNIVASTTEFRILNGKNITYFYPAFTIINTKLLKNVKDLDFSLDLGLDVGGKTRTFIEKNSNSVKFLPNYQSSYFLATLNNNDSIAQYLKKDIEICKEYGLSAGWFAEGFYHYMAGSQWNTSANEGFALGHKKRMNLFLEYFY